ncbi:unnamed protein product [Closterium sp. NIES-64]|nr:unnamed protein product [Closterium sp. NIES-64]
MWYLAYFMHRHLDFRLDELQSLAVLAGVQPPAHHAAPRHDDVELQPPAGSALSEGERGGEKRNEGDRVVEGVRGDEGSEETRRGEGGSEMEGREEYEISGGGGSEWEPVRWRKPRGDHMDSPFFYVDLPSDDVARQIAARSLLIKGIFDIWAEAPTYEALKPQVEANITTKIAPFTAPGSTFKIVVDGFGKIFSMDEQRERMERFTYIPFQGKVKLGSPDYKFWVIEQAAECTNNGLPPNMPLRVFIGREVAVSDRTVATKYELSRRRYLGPTAMDAELSLLMANQALARRGTLMYDPFVGTGSILVAAAHFGAVTLGADIDIRVVRDGKGPNRDVWANFHQYSLQPPVGLLRADNNCPPWRQDLREMFHAIVGDPPYGVRAGGRKSGGRKILNGVTDPYAIADNLKAAHIPSTAPYSLEECLHDLLDTSARLLVIGGRLVYFYPAAREEYLPEEIPGHPCLKLVANSEQILTKRWSRRLVTMVKVAPYSGDMAAAHVAAHEWFRKKQIEESRMMREMGEAGEVREGEDEGSRDGDGEASSGGGGKGVKQGKGDKKGEGERRSGKNFHDLVFASRADEVAGIHQQASVQGMRDEKGEEGGRGTTNGVPHRLSRKAAKQASRPLYRAKCV